MKLFSHEKLWTGNTHGGANMGLTIDDTGVWDVLLASRSDDAVVIEIDGDGAMMDVDRRRENN